MPGRVYDQLATIAADQHGLVTSADARDAGVDPQRLIEMAYRGTIERVSRGVYRFPLVGTEPGLEQLAEATLWPRRTGVLSHDTALDLHELCDLNPARIHVTVPASFRLRRADVPRVYAIHRRDLDEIDKTLHEGIPVVTPQRAILDGIESGIRTDLLRQAMDHASERGLLRGAKLKDLRKRLAQRGRP